MDEDDFLSAYIRSDPTIFEDYGPAEVATGVLDSRGQPIMKSNPRAKQPIGFHRPSSLASKRIIS